MSDYPTIERGTRFGDTRARDWKNLIEDVRGPANITAGPGIQVMRAGQHWNVRVSDNILELLLRRRPQPAAQSAGFRRVVISSVEADHLLVRAVGYAESPPGIGEYHWLDESFRAYPEPGTALTAYASFASADVEPTVDTPMLNAHLQGESWIVHLAESGGAQIEIFQAQSQSTNWLNCHRLTTGERFVAVAKPLELRVIPWDDGRMTIPHMGISVDYEYPEPLTQPDYRFATVTPGLAEYTEIILPPWKFESLSLIAAARVGSEYTGILGVDWLDLNIGGRQWATIR